MLKRKVALVTAEIVDDNVLPGIPNLVDEFLELFNRRFKLGAVAHGPGRLHFYGMNITQQDDMSCFIDAN